MPVASHDRITARGLALRYAIDSRDCCFVPHRNGSPALESLALPRCRFDCLSHCMRVTYTIQSAVFEIRRYRTAAGDEPVTEWLSDLPNRQARARILARIERLEVGNFGDSKFLREGVNELRIDWGPGYRVYFGRDGRTVVDLLCGGDKRRQEADIRRAVELWQEYANRKNRDPRARR